MSLVDKKQNPIANALIEIVKGDDVIISATTDSSGTVLFQWGQEEHPELALNEEVTIRATVDGDVIVSQ